jgi:hypothetical protein
MFERKKLLARIEALEAQVRRLENMHANVTLGSNWEHLFDAHHGAFWETNDGRIGFYGDRQLTAREVQYQSRHPQPNVSPATVDTDRVSKVTLDELARLVIDGTPIRREEKVVSKRISEYTEDTTTRITIPE